MQHNKKINNNFGFFFFYSRNMYKYTSCSDYVCYVIKIRYRLAIGICCINRLRNFHYVKLQFIPVLRIGNMNWRERKREKKWETAQKKCTGKSKIQQPAALIDRSESIFCASFFEFARSLAVRIFMQKYFVLFLPLSLSFFSLFPSFNSMSTY